jgi:hypothetical protein
MMNNCPECNQTIYWCEDEDGAFAIHKDKGECNWGLYS